MTPYESVLSWILAACKILHSSFNEIDAMPVETLADLLEVWEKMNGVAGKPDKDVYIDEIF